MCNRPLYRIHTFDLLVILSITQTGHVSQLFELYSTKPGRKTSPNMPPSKPSSMHNITKSVFMTRGRSLSSLHIYRLQYVLYEQRRRMNSHTCTQKPHLPGQDPSPKGWVGLEDVSTGIAAARQRCLHTSLQSTEKGLRRSRDKRKKIHKGTIYTLHFTLRCIL